MLDAEQIDKKHLEGLVYRSAKQKKTEEGTVNVPTERALAVGDVLNWKDNGASVTIVAGDGQKHVVTKKAEKK